MSGLGEAAPDAGEGAGAFRERRFGHDRRRTTLRTFLQGGFTPRRRAGRRAGEQYWIVDWHDAHLLVPAVAILLLNVADALLTLTLLTVGASEANPFIAFILDAHPKLFAAVKIGMTGLGVLVMVAMARARVFGYFRVATVMHGILAAYVVLTAYECWLLRSAL